MHASLQDEAEPVVTRSLLQLPGSELLLAGGSDASIRMWDLDHIDRSSCVVEHSQATRTTNVADVSRVYHAATLDRVYMTPINIFSESTVVERSMRSIPAGQSKWHRILHSKQRLTHLGSIQDLALLSLPTPKLISAGLDGHIKLWT